MEKHLSIPLALEASGDLISAFAAGGAACVVVGEVAATLPAALGATEKFQIVWKKSDGTIKTSPILCLDWAVDKQTADYAAGTAQVVTLTPTLPSVQAYGDAYTVKIINTTPGTMNLPTKSFTVSKAAVDFSVATLIDAFVAMIGEDETLKVVATDGTATLVLTGTTKWDHFKVVVSDNLEGDSVVYTTPLVPSNGEGAQIATLEQECLAMDSGVQNQVHLSQFYVPAPEAVLATNYDVYTQVWAKPVVTKDGMKSGGVEYYTTIVAENSTGTPATDHLGHLLNAEI